MRCSIGLYVPDLTIMVIVAITVATIAMSVVAISMMLIVMSFVLAVMRAVMLAIIPIPAIRLNGETDE